METLLTSCFLVGFCSNPPSENKKKSRGNFNVSKDARLNFFNLIGLYVKLHVNKNISVRARQNAIFHLWCKGADVIK